MNRYAFTAKLDSGKFYGTWNGGNTIFFAIERGALAYTVKVVKEGVRLDHVSGNVYGDPGYWWIIAAASGIGWGLQIPPGTILRIPTNVGAALAMGR